MLNICTLSDKKYLDKGVTLYRNLLEYYNETEFTFHYLCLDVETKQTLIKLNKPNIKTYLPIGENYESAEQLSACDYGTQYSQFCWACCPIFIEQMMSTLNDGDELLYIDSDIYFTAPPDYILHYIRKNNWCFAVHSHRCEPTLEEWDVNKFNIEKSPVGFYNVGVVYLKKSNMSTHICKAWVNIILHRPPELFDYLKCGDQAILTHLALEYPNDIFQFDNIESGIAHLAPWNTPRYRWVDSTLLCVFEKYQLLCFIHFSHFTPNYEKDTWSSSYNGEWALEVNEYAKAYCEKYFAELKQSKKIIDKNV